MKKYFYLLLMMLVSVGVQAQTVEMADPLRSNGKIYIVVAIILIVLIGLIAYLFILDRKITRLEDKVNARK